MQKYFERSVNFNELQQVKVCVMYLLVLAIIPQFCLLNSITTLRYQELTYYTDSIKIFQIVIEF